MEGLGLGEQLGVGEGLGLARGVGLVGMEGGSLTCGLYMLLDFSEMKEIIYRRLFCCIKP